MTNVKIASELVKIAKVLSSGLIGQEVSNQQDSTVIDLLNRAYADEWLAYHQYWIGGKLMVGQMRAEVEKEFEQHYADELEHAGKIADRIIELGGVPLFGPADWMKNCDCPFADPNDVSVLALLIQNRDGERCAIKGYKKLIDVAKAQGDDVTEELIRGVLADEVSHEQDLQMLLEDFGRGL
jgi:bacterioferritin